MRIAKKIALVFLGLALSVAAAAASQPAYRFDNGRWFDGDHFVERTMFSVGGRFSSHYAGPRVQVVDLRGGYVVPPFGEAHNHNLDASAGGRASIQRYLRAGVLYVANPNSLPRLTSPLRKDLYGPDSIDAIFADGGFTGPGGHPGGVVARNVERGAWTARDGEGAFMHSISSIGDFDKAWPELMRTRPDFVKTYLLYSEQYDLRSKDESFRFWRGLDPKLLPAIVERAHRRGLKVATHVETAHDFRVAVAAGADIIAHMPGFRPDREDPSNYLNLDQYRLSQAEASAAARKGTIVVTTLGDLLRMLDTIPAGSPASALAQAVRRLQVDNLRLLRDAGVKLAIGSDSYDDVSVGEAGALSKLGVFDNRRLLNLWSRDTPQAIFPTRKIGELRPGYEASFVVLTADPLRDFKAVEGVTMVVKRGHVIDLERFAGR